MVADLKKEAGPVFGRFFVYSTGALLIAAKASTRPPFVGVFDANFHLNAPGETGPAMG